MSAPAPSKAPQKQITPLLDFIVAHFSMAPRMGATTAISAEAKAIFDSETPRMGLLPGVVQRSTFVMKVVGHALKHSNDRYVPVIVSLWELHVFCIQCRAAQDSGRISLEDSAELTIARKNMKKERKEIHVQMKQYVRQAWRAGQELTKELAAQLMGIYEEYTVRYINTYERFLYRVLLRNSGFPLEDFLTPSGAAGYSYSDLRGFFIEPPKHPVTKMPIIDPSTGEPAPPSYFAVVADVFKCLFQKLRRPIPPDDYFVKGPTQDENVWKGYMTAAMVEYYCRIHTPETIESK